jgi:plastocyanin
MQHRKRLTIGLGCLVLLLGGCADDKKGTKAGGEGGAKVTVVGKDNLFEPATVKVTADEETTVRFKNEGATPHTFTVKDVGADTGIVNAGQSKDVKIKAASGTLEITCTVHPDMKGELTAS